MCLYPTACSYLESLITRLRFLMTAILFQDGAPFRNLADGRPRAARMGFIIPCGRCIDCKVFVVPNKARSAQGMIGGW